MCSSIPSGRGRGQGAGGALAAAAKGGLDTAGIVLDAPTLLPTAGRRGVPASPRGTALTPGRIACRSVKGGRPGEEAGGRTAGGDGGAPAGILDGAASTGCTEMGSATRTTSVSVGTKRGGVLGGGAAIGLPAF